MLSDDFYDPYMDDGYEHNLPKPLKTIAIFVSKIRKFIDTLRKLDRKTNDFGLFLTLPTYIKHTRPIKNC